MRHTTKGFTLVEILVVLTILTILVAVFLPGISSALEAANRYVCASNMRQLGQAFHMFAGEHDGMLPSGAPNHYWGDPRLPGSRLSFSRTYDPNRLDASYDSDYPINLIRNNYIFDARAVFPDYVRDLGVALCPAAMTTEDLDRERWFMDETFSEAFINAELYDDERNQEALQRLQGLRPDWECVTNEMYTYLPYAIATEEHALFLWDEINRRIWEGQVDFMREEIVLAGEFFDDTPIDETLTGVDVRPTGDRFGAHDPIRDRYDRRIGHAPGGGNVFYRTAFNIGKVFVRNIGRPGDDFVPDTQIPVLFDTGSRRGVLQFDHFPPGGNVLYLDGHVEYQRFEETASPRFDAFGRWAFFSFDKIPYTTDFVEFMRSNIYDNTALINVPPWCGNRLPGTRFEPRYWYYPDDELYEDLFWTEPVAQPFRNTGLYGEDLGPYQRNIQ